MAIRPTITKQLLSGLIFVAIGAGAVIFSLGGSVGSLRQMGAFYFPALVGAILLALGAAICVRALFHEAADPVRFGATRTPLFVSFASICFALLVERAGFVIAVAATMIVSGVAGREIRVWEIALNTLVITALATSMFIYFLQLPWPTGLTVLW